MVLEEAIDVVESRLAEPTQLILQCRWPIGTHALVLKASKHGTNWRRDWSYDAAVASNKLLAST